MSASPRAGNVRKAAGKWQPDAFQDSAIPMCSLHRASCAPMSASSLFNSRLEGNVILRVANGFRNGFHKSRSIADQRQ